MSFRFPSQRPSAVQKWDTQMQSIHINHTHAHRCCSTSSTCLAMSAKLICVRRWVWDEFISTGWESSSHMLDLLGTWEPYPYFPWGDSRWNPDRGMAALNGVEIEKRYLWSLLRAHTHTRTDTHSNSHKHTLSNISIMWPISPHVTRRYDTFASSVRQGGIRGERHLLKLLSWIVFNKEGETHCSLIIWLWNWLQLGANVLWVETLIWS